jgi:hypothetical protein
MSMFEDRALAAIVTGEWRNLRTEEINNLYALFGQDDEVTEDEVWECSTYDENKYIG